MSLVHLKIKQIRLDDDFVEYEVESIDFNEEMEWEKIGEIKIRKNSKDYLFTVSEKHKDKKIIPPTLYSKEEKERENLLNSEYKGFGYGAWSMRINNWINSFIKQNDYPAIYP
jgi:hypothetical protein